MRQLFNTQIILFARSRSLYLSYNTSGSSVIRRCGINLIKLVYQMKFALIRASTQKPNDKEQAAANDFLINNAKGCANDELSRWATFLQMPKLVNSKRARRFISQSSGGEKEIVRPFPDANKRQNVQ